MSGKERRNEHDKARMRKMPKFQTDSFRKRMALYLHAVGQEIYGVYEKERKSEMKKLFISVPMKGRTEEQIRESMRRMHKVAEAVWDEELEVIDSYVAEAVPSVNSEAVWFLGESIKKMADADYFIGVDDYDYRCHGCNVERTVANLYGMDRYYMPIDVIAPDMGKGECGFKESRVDE